MSAVMDALQAHPPRCSCKACTLARITARRTPAGIGAARQAAQVDASARALAARPVDAPALERARVAALYAMRIYRLTPAEAETWERDYLAADASVRRAMCFELDGDGKRGA